MNLEELCLRLVKLAPVMQGENRKLLTEVVQCLTRLNADREWALSMMKEVEARMKAMTSEVEAARARNAAMKCTVSALREQVQNLASQVAESSKEVVVAEAEAYRRQVAAMSGGLN